MVFGVSNRDSGSFEEHIHNCMYVYVHFSVHIRMHACTHLSIYTCLLCIYARLHACIGTSFRHVKAKQGDPLNE